MWDHHTQIHSVAGKKIWTRDTPDYKSSALKPLGHKHILPPAKFPESHLPVQKSVWIVRKMVKVSNRKSSLMVFSLTIAVSLFLVGRVTYCRFVSKTTPIGKLIFEWLIWASFSTELFLQCFVFDTPDNLWLWILPFERVSRIDNAIWGQSVTITWFIIIPLQLVIKEMTRSWLKRAVCNSVVICHGSYLANSFFALQVIWKKSNREVRKTNK